MSDASAQDNDALVIVGNGPLLAPILGRVVGMLAARAQCPIDRLDDALLVADAVAANAGSFTVNGRTGVHVRARPGLLELDVGPLCAQGAHGLVQAADLPGVGNVLERVADAVEAQPDAPDGEHLHIRLGFAT